MSFGGYPDVSIAIARERLAEASKLVASGTDPMAQRKADKTAAREASENSFAAVSARWLEHWWEERARATSIQRDVASTPISCRFPGVDVVQSLTSPPNSLSCIR